MLIPQMEPRQIEGAAPPARSPLISCSTSKNGFMAKIPDDAFLSDTKVSSHVPLVLVCVWSFRTTDRSKL